MARSPLQNIQTNSCQNACRAAKVPIVGVLSHPIVGEDYTAVMELGEQGKNFGRGEEDVL